MSSRDVAVLHMKTVAIYMVNIVTIVIIVTNENVSVGVCEY